MKSMIYRCKIHYFMGLPVVAEWETEGNMGISGHKQLWIRRQTSDVRQNIRAGGAGCYYVCRL